MIFVGKDFDQKLICGGVTARNFPQIIIWEEGNGNRKWKIFA